MYDPDRNFKKSLAAAIVNSLGNLILLILAMVGGLHNVYIVLSIPALIISLLMIQGVYRSKRIALFFALAYEFTNLFAIMSIASISHDLWMGLLILQIKILTLGIIQLHYHGLKKKIVDYTQMREFNEPVYVP